MLCEECGKRMATLHFTKIINGEKTEYHLCEVCAKEKGEKFTGLDTGFSFQDLLSGLLNPDLSQGNRPEWVQSTGLRCPTCGLTYGQFAKMGRFGCMDCYRTFKDRLDPLFRRVHGHTSHRGKVPERTGGRLKIHREIERLKEELSRRVQAEEFEEAARLRDRIRELQGKLESQGG
jgi:protein arginine kinase activator